MKTDVQLQGDVIAELAWEPSIRANQIGVEVQNGVVTLAGHVGSHAEKCAAARAAQRVAGVKALALEMDVKLSPVDVRRDADIATWAADTLAWATAVPQGAVKVAVDSGWITLSGEVEWQYQRQAASDALRHLTGVTGISDEITLSGTSSSADIKSGVEAALKRRAALDAQAIAVHVQGEEVRLSGTVQSLSERELAVDSAWRAPGVHTVIDDLTVAS